MGRCRFGLRDGFDKQLVPLLVYNESISNQPSLSVFGAGHTEQLITTLSDDVISRVPLFVRAPSIPTRCTTTESWKRTLLAWSCNAHSHYQVLAMGRAEETQHGWEERTGPAYAPVTLYCPVASTIKMG